ncbi:MAG: bifunctional phosphopantothenoylcysteine decarboxylase/phosphopantothenate--cysteine ligase CoaBC [Christensenellaceae bacterium]
MWNGINVLLGVTGGIAAYKSAYLTSTLKKLGANVDVIMTNNALNFVTPITFETLSGNPVVTDTFSREKPWEVEHIALAKKADVVIVAPATANTLAKMACGIADNMLTTTLLACKCPIFVAPAMNSAMYENMATLVNLQILKDRGINIIDAKEGLLACGDSGAGRMAEPQEIIEVIEQSWQTQQPFGQDLKDKKILITAGPTRESIDPVRYLTNRSSGKMGYALADAAVKRGAQVTLVSGPVHVKPQEKMYLKNVQCAQDMYDSVMEHEGEMDIIIMCAAVADYAPSKYAEQKIKKQQQMSLELQKTKDILSELGSKKHGYLVGFAAETENLKEYAEQKLMKKNLDMIIANDVSSQGIGFDSEYNAVSIHKRSGELIQIDKDTKTNIANRILTEIMQDID